MYTGTLELLLSGYENIPTDNSALVDITDVGTHAEDRALICRHGITGIPPTNPIDHWTFVSVNGDESSVDSTGFIVTRSQSSGEVRLERPAGIYPLEGTYKCSVMGMTETVTVCLFWPCKLTRTHTHTHTHIHTDTHRHILRHTNVHIN